MGEQAVENAKPYNQPADDLGEFAALGFSPVVIPGALADQPSAGAPAEKDKPAELEPLAGAFGLAEPLAPAAQASENQPSTAQSPAAPGEVSAAHPRDASDSEPVDERAATFAQMNYDTQSRYAVTPQGTFHLTPTELLLVRCIEEHDGEAISKSSLALRLHRNPTVVGRLLSRLRREGVIESVPMFAEGGAQTANCWRIAPNVHPIQFE